MSDILDFPENRMVNPFHFDYFKQEVAFYGPVTPTQVGGYIIDSTQPVDGILRDYLNTNWHVISFPLPRLRSGSKTWMSISPMEVQSLYLPIYEAAYDVYTGGLGLGYFALRAASKPEVDRVIVYELNKDLITWFKAHFADRPEMKKIEVRHADFIQALRNEEIDADDYIFSDVYQKMNTAEAVEHYCEFRPNYDGYRFWCMESLLLDATTYELDVSYIPPHFRKFFSMWDKTTVGDATGDTSGRYQDVTLSNMYREPLWSEDDCETFLEQWNY